MSSVGVVLCENVPGYTAKCLMNVSRVDALEVSNLRLTDYVVPLGEQHLTPRKHGPKFIVHLDSSLIRTPSGVCSFMMDATRTALFHK